jgi:putative hydrolase of the HAD superfamily
MINTIVFDVTGVLVELEDDKFSQAISDKFNLDKDLVKKTYLDVAYQVEEDGRTEYDSYKEIYKKLDVKFDDDLFEWTQKSRISFKPPIKGMRELLLKLKNNYKLGIGSNETRGFAEFTRKIRNLNMFDFTFYSHMAGARKSNDKFFIKMIEENKLEPEECIFIDDNEAYTKTATKFGFLGIHYKNTVQLIEKLKEINIIID